MAGQSSPRAFVRLVVLFFVSLVFATSTCLVSAALTAQEQLVDHGLPPGLLPESVVSYTIDDSGNFEVKLSGECYSTVKDGSITIYYKPILTGVLQDFTLSNLKGISVKPPLTAFIWVSVNKIYVENPSTGDVFFGAYFGIQQSLPVSEFASSKICIKYARLGYSMTDIFQRIIQRLQSPSVAEA